MAHFTKLDENNIVIDIVKIDNSVMLNNDGTESEEKGKDFLNNLFGEATWVQTSYNNNFRKQYAGIGYTYDITNDVFIIPQGVYNSWTLDSNFNWQPPVPKPDSEDIYDWNEDTLTWDLYIEP
tara:strand:+ start:171 stop:539 length:369 start_codon:yes stop_codon:yes gene_type:complete